jgi:glycosyltransferase involved in cell wall biosynthesis
MRILNVTGDAHFPQASGGVQVCLNELMLAFQELGHTPVLLTALWGGKLAIRSKILMRMTRRPWVRDRWETYDVYRKWFPWEHAEELFNLIQPDVILIHGTKYTVKMAHAFLQFGAPVSMYFHDVYFDMLGGDLKSLSGVQFIANSVFTQQRLKELYGVDSHVEPPIFFKAERYRVETTRENVTFINPIPLKGVDVACQLAELCPEIPFHFVQSWQLEHAVLTAIKRRLATLPNVRFIRTVHDMGKIYGKAKVVLAPSQVDESWGRIVSEAQCSGIPALTSNAGGLPEAVGDGGICLDRDAPGECWAEALRSLWFDDAAYAKYSSAAWNAGEKISRERDARLQNFLALITTRQERPEAAA